MAEIVGGAVQRQLESMSQRCRLNEEICSGLYDTVCRLMDQADAAAKNSGGSHCSPAPDDDSDSETLFSCYSADDALMNDKTTHECAHTPEPASSAPPSTTTTAPDAQQEGKAAKLSKTGGLKATPNKNGMKSVLKVH